MPAQRPGRPETGPASATSPPTAGPWVIVVGMHRSGTSAVTGTLTALGLQMARADDLMQGHDSNPEHWESLTAYRINQELLARLGGSWDAPPDPAPGWERDPEVVAGLDPAQLLTEAYTEPGPSVWKDPRVCLLLPYWKLHLPPPVAAVLVWRLPLAVARSLHRRNGMPMADGIALWEHYNRQALAGLIGIDTLVVEYEPVVDDPAGLVSTLVGWLDGLDGFDPPAGGWRTDAALSTIAGDLRHQGDEARPDEDGLVLADQQQLADHLTELHGAHHPLGAGMPAEECPWTRELLGRRREAWNLRTELDAVGDRQTETDGKLAASIERLDDERQRRAETERALVACRRDLAATTAVVERVYASTSWRITRPLRAVVGLLARRGRAGAE